MKNVGIKLKSLLSVCIAGYMTTSCDKTDKPEEDRPNFILIQADDLGWDDLSLHGNEIIETPHIDELAKESVRFNRFYVNPVCAPTRASLLTGRHFLKTGVAHVHGGQDFLNLDETTIAEVLKNAGYATGMWGKWHSGHAEGYFPWERGFDQAYMAQLYKHENSEGKLNGQIVKHKHWADRVIFDYAISFIQKNQNKPFFAYISSLTCHSPLRAPGGFIEKYKAKGLSDNLATLYAMVEHLDFHIDRLLLKVKELGLENNTVIIFMSDNGPAINFSTLSDKDREIRYVNNYKGHKGNIWENGVKSPLFIRWPGTFEPGIINQLIDVTDIYPTIANLAKAEYPHKQLPLDGTSFLDILKGKTQNNDTKRSFNYAHFGWQPSDLPYDPAGRFEEYRPVTPEEKKNLTLDYYAISIQNQDYKLMYQPKKYPNTPVIQDGFVLVDMNDDTKEENNIYTKEPEIAAEMKKQLFDWFEEIKHSPGSFRMPLFYIHADSRVNEIYAKAPFKISPGLKNTVHFLTDWDTPGEFAEYKIKPLSEGTFHVYLTYDSLQSSGATFAIIASSGEKLTFGLQDKTQTFCGELPLTPSDSLLHLELTENPSGDKPFDKLLGITLKNQ